MKITGPYITKTIHIPAHDIEVFDEDAYWWLDWVGMPDDEGGYGYAKVAYPTLKEAQRQHAMEHLARQAERGAGDRARKAAKKKAS